MSGDAPGDRSRPVPLVTVRLSGALDTAALAAAVAEAPGASLGPAPRVLDLSRLDAARQRRVATDLAAAPGPGGTAHLIHVGASAWELTLFTRPGGVDAWSLPGALAALGDRYTRRVEGSPAPPASPGDTTGTAGAAAHWRRLREDLPTPATPPEPPRAAGGPPAATWTVEDGTESARRAARALGATPDAVLLAAFAAVLGRYLDTDDLAVAVPADPARRPGDPGRPAGLPHSLPLLVRLRPAEASAFDRLVARVEEGFADARAQHPISTAALSEVLGAPVEEVCQISFGHGEDPDPRLDLPGVTAALDPAPPTARHRIADLTAGAGRAVLTWPAAWRSVTSGDRFAAHLAAVLRAVAANPRALLDGIDPPGVPDPRPSAPRRPATDPATDGIHQHVRRYATLTPDTVAVRHDRNGREDAVTYRELDAWSDRVAHRLRAAGAGPGRFVALRLPGGAVQAAALVAVARTGAAFVCLNPSDPPDRIATITADVGPVCLLAVPDEHETPRMRQDPQKTGEHPLRTDPSTGLPVVPVSPCPPEPSGGTPVPFDPAPPRPDAPLCLVHTSGSTGLPKGIALAHAAFVQFADWQRETFALGPGSRVAQWAPFTYDAAYTEVFAALTTGATLCVPPEGARRDPLAVLRWLRRERVTQLQTVPAFLRLVLEALSDEAEATGTVAAPTALEHVLLAGEVLPPDLAARWHGSWPDPPRLHNLYGPTECILATHRPLSPGEDHPDTVPVGRAIPGRDVLVLDRHLRPCPPGVTGDLHLRSPFLATAYHRRPVETALAHRPDPWRPGGTLYRTGDLGRLLPDGELAFAGRADNQVKVRGNRVELEEVEAVLERFPAVREGAVAAHSFGPGEWRLVGYAAVEGGATPADLRRHLSSLLPAAAVPDLVVLLDALPRTRTGKRDRARLPRPPAWPAA
ncbi:amino acid adenylation domain-containing protein [Streptomyces sp. NPDC003717]|uniref:amino acid adenylation domain-containing protein n=1 Tax=Streptomyces sp. NPDC003717 TaxID=3154276 RepID=UPI0033B75F7B